MEQNRSLGLLSISRKGANVTVGEEQVGAVARAGRARLLLLAQDASYFAASASMLSFSRMSTFAAPNAF